LKNNKTSNSNINSYNNTLLLSSPKKNAQEILNNNEINKNLSNEENIKIVSDLLANHE
jgi:hypothetical protein